jgi:hypothetical protein
LSRKWFGADSATTFFVGQQSGSLAPSSPQTEDSSVAGVVR